MTTETLIFERRGAFLIQLLAAGEDCFRVRYGLQEWVGDYAYAARKLGEALMHDLACEGKIAE